ncbi:MAG TPA: long-chain fatty acid--CoA ligase [Deltaproteobacteria bacterium]|nr:long-chain fatty acid--CoA ligase [Deltaproteobacteria bacterium]
MAYTHYSQIFRDQVKKNGDKAALRAKEDGTWREITWRSFGEQVTSLAKALVDEGIGIQETIGIFSQNMPECHIADIAALTVRAIPVYIYPTNTAKQAEYLVNDAEIKVVFVGDQEQYDKIMQILPNSTYLKRIVVFKKRVQHEKRDDVTHFPDFLEKGRGLNNDQLLKDRQDTADGEDLIRIIYTSGTTGEPKGVMLTHEGAMHALWAHDQRLIDPNENDVNLSFLPLSHVFEGMWTYFAFYHGMVNNYLEDPSKIIDFIQEVKPTIMCAVPRFYEKIYAAIFDRLESAPPKKKKLFHWAIQVGRERNNRKKDLLPISPLLRMKYALADALVLRKLRALTGGRIKFFPCAGAPLAQEIEEFFYAMGVFIDYGYGLTETSATVTCHEPHNFRFGLVGTPLPGVEVKIDPKNSEILVRGKTVMKGYYKKPEATAEVFTEDGYFRTGDAGVFEDNGELRITDRIKDLMKTAGGKYIAPQLIESMLLIDHYIEQVAVIGDQRKFVTALIVPSFVNLEGYAKAHGIAYSSREDLISRPEIIAFYQNRIDEDTKELARYEKVKRFTLLSKEFTVDAGELTPTFKTMRKVVNSRYKDLIESMYQE